MRKKYFILYRLLPFVFLLFILLPFINGYIPIIEIEKSSENRLLAEMPEFDINHLDPFPDLYEEYYNDKFTFRNSYIFYYNYVRFKLLHINPFPNKVVLGKDNWMFYKNDMTSTNDSIIQFTESDLKKIANELKSRGQYLSEHNCQFYIGIIPSKASIYYDKLNNHHNGSSNDTIQSRTKQLLTYLNDNSDLKIVDLSKILIDNKEKYQVYRKYDHHWNSIGGFFASKKMLEFIQKDLPESNINISLEDYDIQYIPQVGGDLAMILGVTEFCVEQKPVFSPKETIKKPIKGKSKGYSIPEKFAYGWGYEVRRTTNNISLPNCMVIRDSYGSYFSDFISRGFNNTFFLWDEWKYEINKDIFLKESPDILIIMIPEADLLKLKNKSS